jgi:hypothetical protein
MIYAFLMKEFEFVKRESNSLIKNVYGKKIPKKSLLANFVILILIVFFLYWGLVRSYIYIIIKILFLMYSEGKHMGCKINA